MINKRWHIQMQRPDGEFDCYHELGDQDYIAVVVRYYVEHGYDILCTVYGPWWLSQAEPKCIPIGATGER